MVDFPTPPLQEETAMIERTFDSGLALPASCG